MQKQSGRPSAAAHGSVDASGIPHPSFQLDKKVQQLWERVHELEQEVTLLRRCVRTLFHNDSYFSGYLYYAHNVIYNSTVPIENPTGPPRNQRGSAALDANDDLDRTILLRVVGLRKH